MLRVLLVLASIVCSAATAAPYKWIDENGRVVYGDRPPVSSARPVPAPGAGTKGGAGAQAAVRAPAASPDAASGATSGVASGAVPGAAFGVTGTADSAASGAVTAAAAGAGAGPLLPAALPGPVKQAATRFPVVLYTGSDCAPCTTARDHLVRRGIPFSERSLGSGADIEAFRKLGFTEMTVPAFSVGREKQTGYERGAWDRLLDAAGYPKSSAMPSGCRPAAAEPLVAESAGQGRVVERIVRQERPGADAPPLPVVPASAPSSIRF